MSSSGAEVVGKGNFGSVTKRRIKDEQFLKENKQITTYAGLEVAVKEPQGENFIFLGIYI